MVEHTTGIVCAAMPPADLDRLALPLMVPLRENEEAMCTAFTVTVDGRHTTSTGVSASDRCRRWPCPQSAAGPGLACSTGHPSAGCQGLRGRAGAIRCWAWQIPTRGQRISGGQGTSSP